VYGLAVRVTALLRLKEAVRDRGKEQLASLRSAAMISGRVAVMIKESLGRVGVMGAPYREVNSKVATAPKLKAQDKDRVKFMKNQNGKT